MQNRVFEMIETLLELSAFELEYQHRSKSNPFMEKWIHCTNTKYRTKKLRDFLYSNLLKFLESDLKDEFYRNTLKNYLNMPLEKMLENVEMGKQTGEMDVLYRNLYYRFSLDELFILLTNLVTWEHIQYPYLLERAVICDTNDANTKLLQNQDILHYYIRFLDLLSSTAIISLFDLDALKHTIKTDQKKIGLTPLMELNIYRDWPRENEKHFDVRFPEFKVKLKAHMELFPNCI